MRVVVTGATGFLGKHVVKYLQKHNFQPIALGRNTSIGAELSREGILFISVDLNCRDTVIHSFAGADYVIHCAGLSSVWGPKAEFHKANVLATKNVVEACQIHGVKRLIHISTPSLYFDYTHKYNITEQDPLPKTFVNAYAESKKEGEELVLIGVKNGLSAVILRPRGIFGPGDTSIFPRLLSAMQRNKLPLIEGGEALIEMTYVGNVVDAIILAMQSENDIDGQIYNITNDEPRTFLAFLQSISEKMQFPLRTRDISFRKAYYGAKCVEGLYRLLSLNKEPPITCYSVGLVAKSMTFDISKAKNELGYHPIVSIDEGLDAFAHWWSAKC